MLVVLWHNWMFFSVLLVSVLVLLWLLICVRRLFFCLGFHCSLLSKIHGFVFFHDDEAVCSIESIF